MKRLFFLIGLCLTITAHAQNIPQVPSKIQIADISLTITEGAKKDIQKDVDMLRSSEKFFRIKLDRVVLYMPLVERLLKEEGIPDDIKYLAIQESSFIPHAVSTSKAVGYWQFKEFTAKDMGMRVDNKIDDRKNIHASTRGAARYFRSHQRQLNNWMNSINAHMTGPAGIKKYISPNDRGASKMTITKKTHWYLKRFIAHKIAFQDELDHKNSKGLELLEYKKGAGKDLEMIAKEFKIEVEKLKAYNKWLIHGRIPGDKSYVVMVPVQRGNRKAVQLAENSDSIEQKKTAAKEQSKPQSEVIQPQGKVESFVRDQAGVIRINGVKAIIASSRDDFKSLLARSGLKERKFLKFNDLGSPPKVKAGDIYFIKKKKKKSPIGFYTVGHGESLWKVSQKFGIRLSALAKKNRMAIRDVPKPGRVLWLSANRPSGVEVEYQDLPEVVEKPKVIYSEEVKKEQQPVTGDEQIEDEKISTPIPDSEPAKRKPEAKISRDQTYFETYIVQAGDTYWRIAEKYGITVEEILEWNGLAAGVPLSIGQELLIDGNKVVKVSTNEGPPKQKKTTKIHVVRGGETFYAIARKYEMEVNDLFEWNGLDPTALLSVGQELKVAGTPEEPEKKAETPNQPVAKQPTIHVVKAGESFYGIARQYEMKVDDLLALNDLSSADVLAIGQALKLSGSPNEQPIEKDAPSPSVEAETEIHVVQAGESFYAIARQYGLTIDDLLKLNDLQENAILSIGQELLVAGLPAKEEEQQASSEKQTVIHEVQSGDTLYNIARKYQMTVDELKELNDKESNSLSLGEKLKVYK